MLGLKMTDKPLAIKVEKFTKKYGTYLRHSTIYRSKLLLIRFSVSSGPDGAGKTSLLRILSGILLDFQGEVSVLDLDVSRHSEKVKQELGYMAQKFALYADLTVIENLDFAADLYQTPTRGLKARKLELLKFADLLQFQNRFSGRYFRGDETETGALLHFDSHSPDLILDEPTTGVDPVSRWNSGRCCCHYRGRELRSLSVPAIWMKQLAATN